MVGLGGEESKLLICKCIYFVIYVFSIVYDVILEKKKVFCFNQMLMGRGGKWLILDLSESLWVLKSIDGIAGADGLCLRKAGNVWV